MATVFFVDDDVLTLTRLRDLIDWNAHGYEIVGQAMDGEAGLARITALRPDVVILDINMPRKSGIAVAEALQALDPQPYVLVLSNHDTFEYVRQVMRYGVRDYMLKHELTAGLLLRKLREIDQQRTREDLSRQWDEHASTLGRQQYLRALVTGGALDGQQHRLMRTQPVFSADTMLLAVLHIVNLELFTFFDGEAERTRIVETVTSLAHNVLSQAGDFVITHVQGGTFALLFGQDAGLSFAQMGQQTQAWVSMLAANLSRLLSVQPQWALSGRIADVGQVEAAYRALQARHGSGAPAMADMQHEHIIIEALSALDIERTQQVLAQVIARQGIGTAQHLLRISRQFMETHDIQLKDTYLRQFQNRFRSPLDEASLREIMTEHYTYLLRDALSSAWRGYSPYIQSAVAFIHEHYASDISLPAAAEHVGISSAYLSRQFRKETGQPFIDYLTQYRIEVAKRLLCLPGARIKNVCAQVGFQNYNYFLRVFKKITGQTAKQCVDAARHGGEGAEAQEGV